MSGHCIESEDFVIVVDKWDASFLRRPRCKPHYFFLTHLHADHIKGLTSTWSRIIYTSPFNAWLLPMRRNVKPMLLKEIELNVTQTIRKSNNEIAFQVTLLDANHCPGAVMFLFQGKFGNVLYTGDFRYSSRLLDNPVLSQIIRNKELSLLYVDNTYAAPSCKFPSRDDALKEVLRIIDENPDCKILIGMRQLGKEEVLKAIALHVNEKVCVSNQRLQILSKLEYEDVFTTDTTQSRIHAVELHTITQRHNQEASKTVSIKLTSMYECGNTDRQRGNIYVVPYSDHSSHTELKEFVDRLRPLKLYPIVLPKIPKVTSDTGPWYRMSAVNCVIPQEIFELCGPAAASSPASEALQVSSNGPASPIKFHPAPKIVDMDNKSPSATYIDEGLDILPFDSLGSHLTNNNKARKHIKASWTRLAPKLLAQKGIKFDSSPEKSSDGDEEPVPKQKVVDACSSSVIGPKSKEAATIAISPIAKVNKVINYTPLQEVNLSDGDDELDMPSSASELVRRLNLPTSTAVNGIGTEDRRSECSIEIVELFEDSGSVRKTRNKTKCENPSKPAAAAAAAGATNDSKDSISDVSSSKRTTRSKASVGSSSVLSRPRTRLSTVSLGDGVANSESSKKTMVTKKSTRVSPNAKLLPACSPNAKLLPPSSLSTALLPPRGPKLQRNGLARNSVSLENLSIKASIKGSSPKKLMNESKGNLGDVVNLASPKKKPTRLTTESIGSSISQVAGSPRKTPLKVKGSVVEVKLNLGQEDGVTETVSRATDKIQLVTEKDAHGKFSSQSIESSASGKSIVDSSCVALSETGTTLKKIPNGNLLFSNFNGIHINSPGRKRVPLSCDWNAAQEIAKKETEQALKALETLNQMKGFKTRNVANRSGLVALRRLSADNIPTKMSVKNQSNTGVSKLPTGLRRRTASILSSMASTFSKPSPTEQPSPPPAPQSQVQEISPILPLGDVKKLQKGKLEMPVKGEYNRDLLISREKEPQMIPIDGKIEEGKLLTDATGNSSGPLMSKGLEEQQHVIPVVKIDDAPPLTIEDSKEESPDKLDSKVGSTFNSSQSTDLLNQGLFLTDDTLALTSTSNQSSPKPVRRTYYKKQNDLNVDLIKLKVGFAITRKGPKRLSLSSRLSSLRKESLASPFQNKEKVQDWKKKISQRLRKSPQRRYKYKSPNKLQESAKRTLATILRSGRNLKDSQGYYGDVEDCTELTQNCSQVASSIENSGYIADAESNTFTSEKSQVISDSVLNSSASISPSVISDIRNTQDSKEGILNDLRRSSRLWKEDPIESSNCRLALKNPRQEKNSAKNDMSSKTTDSTSLQKKSDKVLSVPKGLSNSGPGGGTLPVNRFSDRLSEKSRVTLSKNATDNVLAPKSPSLLSLMADAFKKTVSYEAPTTANILSSMAENFKKLDEAKVSSSLSIQLISGKSQRIPPKDADCSDWGVQITRVESASSKTQLSVQTSSPECLSPINAIPKSLSIEIIPESDQTELILRKKGPSPPTVTISPEIIDLSEDFSEPALEQSTIHSLPLSGSGKLAQSGTRWQPKPEIESPPPAVWKEKRGNMQTGDNVIIDIQTQETPQKVPHCPVHCTCAAVRQGTCMGSMRNLIEADADCLYEVPFSPDDFENSEAMLALGRGWIESCFEDAEDREEFLKSYEDILPSLSDTRQRRIKSSSANVGTKGNVQRVSQTHMRRVFSPTKQTNARPKPLAAVKSSAAAKKQSGISSQTKSKVTASKLKQMEDLKKKKQMEESKKKKQMEELKKVKLMEESKKMKLMEESKKKTATVNRGNVTLLKDIEKKIKAYSDEQSKKQPVGKTLPSRRASSQSTSSCASSVPKSRSSRRSLSPPTPPAVPAVPKCTQKPSLSSKRKAEDSDAVEGESKQSQETRRRTGKLSTSGSDSPESKRARCNELERLTDIEKGGATKRYCLSVRRSLDHLMTRQKLRSDRRVKASNSSRT